MNRSFDLDVNWDLDDHDETPFRPLLDSSGRIIFLMEREKNPDERDFGPEQFLIRRLSPSEVTPFGAIPPGFRIHSWNSSLPARKGCVRRWNVLSKGKRSRVI